jgi:cytochrome c553
MDPDWYKYLDPQRRMAGGVPFIIRLSGEAHGLVVTPNLTPDTETGLGGWSEDEIVEVLRTAKRKDGSVLFTFPPHSFYKNLALEDARAIARYLKSLPPIRNPILPRQLPFEPLPMVPEATETAPHGRTRERATYLMSALVGCKECHSHHQNGTLVEFAGGNPSDAFQGSFRLGPDLPLRQAEKGFAAFPFPGYAVLYGSNLTNLGQGGAHGALPAWRIVRAIRQGIDVHDDEYGRPRMLAHIMMWQFYRSMSDTDAYALADYLKDLTPIANPVGPRLKYFGTDWEAAFQQVFNEPPTPADRAAFGK